MKNFVGKLKTLNYKKLAINHAEKFVVGVIGLIVVLIVFMPLIAGNFTGYDKTPEELTDEAVKTDKEIDNSQWPEAEKIKYQESGDLPRKVAGITEPVPLGSYNPSNEVAPPLYRKKEPRKEISWLIVDNLVSVSGRGHFEIPMTMDAEGFFPNGSEGLPIDEFGGIAIPLAGDDVQNEIPKEFRRKRGPRNAGAGLGGVGGGVSDGYGGVSSGFGGVGGGVDDGAGSGGIIELDYDAVGMMEGGMYGEEFGGGMAGPTMEGRGYRYALLTGIYTIRAQRVRIAEALSIPEVALNSPTIKFDLLGFEVARKEGTGPWPKVEDHQVLDISRSMDVLMELAGFDFDPVGYGVKHHQITSPLPPRIVGEWGDDVAHPKISNYVLNTEEGKNLDEYLTTYIAGLEDKNKKLRDLYEKNTKFGFGVVQRNIQGISNQVFGGMNGQMGMQNFQQGYQNMYGGGNMGESGYPGSQQAPGRRLTPTQKKDIKSAVDRITAAGTLLLFRYFDFDVEPGKSYQYRVRLIFENPNFNVPVSELEDPDSRLGEIRKTPWSQLTKPITILKDTEYYLTKVSIPRGKKNEASTLRIYQWKQDIGTVVSSELDSHLGQYIGGEKLAEVLKVTTEEFVQEKVEFTSDDLLVDSSQGIDVNYKDHADLNLPKRLSRIGALRIMDEALVQDASGRLFLIDPFSSNTEKQNSQQRFEWQNQAWQFLKELPEGGEMGAEYGLGGECDESFYGGAEYGGMGDEEGRIKKPRGRRAKYRRKNKLKKNFGSFGSSMGMGGMGMGGMGGISGSGR